MSSIAESDSHDRYAFRVRHVLLGNDGRTFERFLGVEFQFRGKFRGTID